MKKFTTPILEVSAFSMEDIIATSGCDGYTECGSQTGVDWGE